jgi:hypothetical protein
LYTFLSSSMRATCPARLIRLDFTCLGLTKTTQNIHTDLSRKEGLRNPPSSCRKREQAYCMPHTVSENRFYYWQQVSYLEKVSIRIMGNARYHSMRKNCNDCDPTETISVFLLRVGPNKSL